MASIGSVEEYFQTLPQRFQPQAAKGVHAVFQFELDGSGGGTYHVRVDDTTLTIHAGAHPEPNVTLKMNAGDYVKMASGKINGHFAAMTGKLKISGDMMLAMKMQALFPPG
jgi:putative sterol carrier protein